MPQINISSSVTNETNNDSQLQNFVLNVNMKTPKILSNWFLSVFLASLITFMTATVLLIYQVNDLQTQMNSLMLMYQENNESNRINESNRFHQSLYYDDPVNPVVPSTFEHSNQTEVRDDRNSNIILKPYNQQNFLRSEMQNYTTTEDKTSSDHKLISLSELRARRLRRNQKDSEERQNEKKGETLRQNEKEYEKQQFSEKENEEQEQSEDKSKNRQIKKKKEEKRRQSKSEKRRQSRRERERKHKRLRPLVATFIGAAPESLNTVIGPWMKKSVDHQYDFTKFHLVDNNMAIQVGISGLYIISVQIFYVGNINHSYWVLLNAEGTSTKRKLITCATASLNAEVSCYTSIILYLQEGDRLSLQQQQKDRLIKLEEGYSQIQITLLDSNRRHPM